MDTPSDRPSGRTISVRIPEPAHTRVEIAAQLQGVGRSAYARDAIVRAADRDLERLRERSNR